MEQTDEQKKAMEEQLRYREMQAKMMLKQLAVNKKLVERAVERIKADREVVEKVELKEEKNELRRAALKARLAEMDAVLEGERLKLEMVDMNKEVAEKQLEEIAKLLSK
jgi:CRISPR/Cas system CSM-associated protein Csm3 (group 7 of RAMP superfamily)